MTTGEKDPVIVVLQLSGGNDYLNTVIPYTDPNDHDNRPTLRVPESDVLPLDDRLGPHPAMAPLKEIYDQGDMAIVHGIGYENSPRSHFRSMDIWHTCEPNKVGTEGWLGRAVRDIDPQGDNPVTAVNIGQGLPRALSVPGVSVASVPDVSTYGLLTDIERGEQRQKMLESFVNMYKTTIGPGPVMDYIGRTGLDALKGTDILKVAPERYSSSVEYGANPIAEKLRDIAMLRTADLGTRIFYTDHGSFDTHASQSAGHPKLWSEVSEAIVDFWDDLREHGTADNVVMLLFSEFGRRVKDNGSGTDHGAAGVAFLLGPQVKGGMHGEYPETRAEALDQGDLVPNQDFRGLYSSVLDDWLRLDSVPIVDGQFERPGVIERA